MFVLAHLAAGYLAGRLWNFAVRRHPINLFLAALGGMLPDLIDKPLAMLPWWQGGRSIAHTLLFLLVLVALVRVHRYALPLALGVATHLVLDDPSTFLQTLFWPLLGPSFTANEFVSLQDVRRYLVKPRASFGEILGGAILLAAAARYAWSTIMAQRKFRHAVQQGRPQDSATAMPVDAE